MSEINFCFIFVPNKATMFSKTTEYGIRAMIFVMSSSLEDKRVRLKEIAAAIDSPESFTAKILQTLSRANVVDSVKGPHGGFEINKDKMQTLALIDVVIALDGNKLFDGCGLGLKACNSSKPCPLHEHFLEVRTRLKVMLVENKIIDLAQGLQSGLSFLKQ